MGYIASSYATNYMGAPTGADYSVTIPVAGKVGDVYVCTASCGTPSQLNGLSSANISWQLAEVADHTANNQFFNIYVGRVTTAFSANTEVVTVDILSTAIYREVSVAGYRAELGYAFKAATYFEDATHVTYGSGNPTGANGFSTTPVLSGTGKHLLIGVSLMESGGSSLANLSVGTSPLTMVEDAEWAMFGTVDCPGAYAHALYDGGTDQAITATFSTSSGYGTSLVGIALLQQPQWELQGVGSNFDNQASVTLDVDVGITLTAGMLVAVQGWCGYPNERAVTSITARNAGNTADTDTGVLSYQAGTGLTRRPYTGYVLITTGGGTKIRVTLSGGGEYHRTLASVWAGHDATTPFTAGKTAAIIEQTYAPGTDNAAFASITPPMAGCLYVATLMQLDSNTDIPNAGTGMTSLVTEVGGTGDAGRMEYAINAGTSGLAMTFSPINSTWTSYNGTVQVFNPIPSGGGGPPPGKAPPFRRSRLPILLQH